MAQVKNKKTLAKRDTDEILARMERAIADKPEAPVAVKVEAALPIPRRDIEWLKKTPAKVKTTVVRCIIIDKTDHWHDAAMVDLLGKDTSGFAWGYYGKSYPVLVEDANGLLPFYLPDAAGESSNRLFKGANPDGFRATFRHRSNLLQKLQVGLMVALVLGLFFIMFILINQ